MQNIMFVSLGCDKNLVDTEHMLGSLEDGYSVTNDETQADVIVINTCGFIDEAKEESIQTVLEMAEQKETGRCRALIVAGCMAEYFKEEVLKELPEVDAVIGTGSFERINEAVQAVMNNEENRLFFDAPEAAHQPRKRKKRLITTGGHYEYLKIAEGCDKHCTYCIIPKLRGAYHSVPMEDLVEEAKELVSEGVKELILIAEETTRYGIDLYGKKSLHLLLEELCKIDELQWIRILYCYPEEIYPELVQIMKAESKICHYLDLPIQHANDRILSAMGRRTTKQQLMDTVRMLRKEIPDIVLRTTLITGFPGETDDEHAELLDFISELRFERLGVFTYSKEDGTPAARMPEQIDAGIKAARKDELLRKQQEISIAYGDARIGTVMDVHIEGYMAADEVYVGRTYADIPSVDGMIFVHTDRVLDSGMFVKALVTGATEYDLIEELEETDEFAE